MMVRWATGIWMLCVFCGCSNSHDAGTLVVEAAMRSEGIVSVVLRNTGGNPVAFPLDPPASASLDVRRSAAAALFAAAECINSDKTSVCNVIRTGVDSMPLVDGGSRLCVPQYYLGDGQSLLIMLMPRQAGQMDLMQMEEAVTVPWNFCILGSGESLELSLPILKQCVIPMASAFGSTHAEAGASPEGRGVLRPKRVVVAVPYVILDEQSPAHTVMLTQGEMERYRTRASPVLLEMLQEYHSECVLCRCCPMSRMAVSRGVPLAERESRAIVEHIVERARGAENAVTEMNELNEWLERRKQQEAHDRVLPGVTP